MKKKISKTEAREKIDEFFSRSDFEPEETKKIRRLAMKYRISLRNHKKKFCKKCFSKLRGKTRVSKVYRSIECESCKHTNRISLR